MEKERFIFDIDGTLLAPDYSYEQEYFKSVLSYADAEVFIPNISKLLLGYEAKYSRYDMKKLSRYLTAHSGVLITEKIIKGWKKALSETESIIIDGVVETLEELSRKDKSMAILTNWFLGPQEARLKKCGLRDYFDDIYGGEFSIKPTRQSYLMACGEYPVDVCVMIGDTLEKDVYGAMNVGMDAVYYNPKNNDNFDKRKVKSIRNMSEIGRMY